MVWRGMNKGGNLWPLVGMSTSCLRLLFRQPNSLDGPGSNSYSQLKTFRRQRRCRNTVEEEAHSFPLNQGQKAIRSSSSPKMALNASNSSSASMESHVFDLDAETERSRARFPRSNR